MLTGPWPTSCMICLVLSWVGWLVQGAGTSYTHGSELRPYLDMLTGFWPTSCMICLVMSWVGWLVQGAGTSSTMGVNSVHTWIC